LAKTIQSKITILYDNFYNLIIRTLNVIRKPVLRHSLISDASGSYSSILHYDLKVQYKDDVKLNKKPS